MDGGVDDQEGEESDESNFSDDLESEGSDDDDEGTGHRICSASRTFKPVFLSTDEDESDFDMSEEDESDEFSDEEEVEGEDWEGMSLDAWMVCVSSLFYAQNSRRKLWPATRPVEICRPNARTTGRMMRRLARRRNSRRRSRIRSTKRSTGR
jgi:hypothetical protein